MFTIHKKNAKLILSDGTQYEGVSIGAKGTVFGEIVFNTSMTGYIETLTDASYFGQIVLQTYPLIGNYGVNVNDAEGKKPQLSGYVVKSCCNNPSNFRSELCLKDWLVLNKVVGIEGLDTRHLTKKIREQGVMNAAITTELNENEENIMKKIKEFKIKDAIKTVSTKSIQTMQNDDYDDRNFKICIIDFGTKENIIRNVKKLAKTVVLMPYNTTKEDILKIKPDGIVLSNGPGDPALNPNIIYNIKQIQSLNIPMFGICMGHQILALANGARTEKLKYGHRGANQPVLDINLNKILITSQNHGYCVIGSSIEKGIGTVSHINANDGSCEGIEYKNIPAFSVQFHPEAAAGPLDANFLFDNFFKLITKYKNKLNYI